MDLKRLLDGYNVECIRKTLQTAPHNSKTESGSKGEGGCQTVDDENKGRGYRAGFISFAHRINCAGKREVY